MARYMPTIVCSRCRRKDRFISMDELYNHRRSCYLIQGTSDWCSYGCGDAAQAIACIEKFDDDLENGVQDCGYFDEVNFDRGCITHGNRTYDQVKERVDYLSKYVSQQDSLLIHEQEGVYQKSGHFFEWCLEKFKEKLKDMEPSKLTWKEKYALYLSSPRWKNISETCKDLANYECQLCGSSEKLHAHHTTYKNKGTDKEIDDLQCLCDTCHTNVHEMAKESGIKIS